MVQQWGGLRFDVKCQVTNFSTAPCSSPPYPKFVVVLGEAENKSLQGFCEGEEFVTANQHCEVCSTAVQPVHGAWPKVI